MLGLTATVIKEKRMRIITSLLVLQGLSLAALAETPADFLSSYAGAARQENAAFGQPSPSRGQQLFLSTHGKEWSCSSCHTKSPTATGRHQVTGKSISPLAPVANPARFTNPRKVEKWFGRNCGDVLGRACTGQEKADVLAYLLSLRY
jgi:hypothetical protein